MDTEHSPTLVAAFHDLWPTATLARQTALIDHERHIDYATLFHDVGRLSGLFRAAGIKTGDRVAIAIPRSINLCITLLALLSAGACPTVMEPGLGPDEVRRRFTMTRIGWLIVDAGEVPDPALAGLPDVTIVSLDALPADAAPFWATDIAPDQPAFLLFTSGSSGKPKGVLQSHRGLSSNAHGIVAHTALGTDDRLLHLMPLYHTNGVNNQLLAPLLAGSTVVMADRFKADDVPALISRFRPTILTGVPTMYSRMLATVFDAEALDGIRMLRCGSAPITEELHRRVEAHFGRPLVISYGLSEATCTSTMNPPGARRVGSVGTVLQGQSVYLTDPDGKRIDAPQRDGEICIAGPSLMLGYVQDGGGGTPTPPGGVIRTGDLGRFDADGYLFITGRIKDVIIRGGENLSPTLIESVLAKVAGVQACCVVGRKHDDLGEVPLAYIVRTPDAAGTTLSADRLGDAIASELSRVHKPAGYVFVESLPENSVGKIDRRALAERAMTEPV